MELTTTLLAAVVLWAPAVKDWLDSMAHRNRLLARAEIIRARLASSTDLQDVQANREEEDE
ncbi:hypothetical protein OG785_32365 [Streptomyces sp. NBC_00006]|uniref:hypothetical protein n=1 Tax=Streptomyces sp. NBC_00006 TaxID=2975619 RepID=UPI00224D1222|nr:hypothetical protein [Streptomyces sp. NBC_00006]MCX5535232.1 hypothetical protein [Streptomyces sp. NBC_00006]